MSLRVATRIPGLAHLLRLVGVDGPVELRPLVRMLRHDVLLSELLGGQRDLLLHIRLAPGVARVEVVR